MNYIDIYVYFAVNRWIFDRFKKKSFKFSDITFPTLASCIKAGYTHDVTQRKYKLRYKENIDIYKYIHFKGTEVEGTFLEHYVKMRIEKKYCSQVQHSGNDHFYCKNSNILKSIEKNIFRFMEDGMREIERFRGESIPFEMVCTKEN